MGTKMAVAFANIFMADIETQIVSQSVVKPTVWKRTNSSKTTFEDNIKKFKSRLLARGYPNNLIENILSDVKFTERSSDIEAKRQHPQTNIAFCNTISTISAQPQTCFNEKMALNTKPAFPTRNLQRATTNFL